jgi:hypothetical protein
LNQAYIDAMWLMFLRAPGQEKPDVDGSFWLGEIGETKAKSWTRMTPYSVARSDDETRILDIDVT